METKNLMDDSLWKGSFFTGAWQATDRTAAVTDKASGKVLSQIGLATVADLAAAARTASAAQPAWADMPPNERAANWEEFTQWQWITLRDAPPPYPF